MIQMALPNFINKLLRSDRSTGAVRGRLYDQEDAGNVIASRGQAAKVVGIKLIRADGSVEIIKEAK